MRNGSLETRSVAQVAAAVAGADQTLREYGIDPTNRMTLRQAVSAASTTSDEVLAVMEARMRRQAQRIKAQPQVHVYEEELEGVFVA